jgi:hypothetical protein
MTTELTRSQLHDLAAKVAAEMGWEPDPGIDTDDSYFARIRSMDGIAVTLHAAREPGKLHVTGSYPRTNYYFRAGEHGSINVSRARGTHAVAADISRRLVPTVIETTAKIRAFDAREQSEEASRLGLVAVILETLAGVETHLPGHSQNTGRSQILVRLPGTGGYTDGGWLDILADGPEVTFERFRVPAAAAVRMLAAITAQLPSAAQSAAARSPDPPGSRQTSPHQLPAADRQPDRREAGAAHRRPRADSPADCEARVR